MGRRDFFQKKLFMVAGKGWGGGGGRLTNFESKFLGPLFYMGAGD